MRRTSSSRQFQRLHLSISEKANKLLHFILIALLLILFRIWHLTFVQHDQRLEEAKKPQRKVIIERAERATIRDRFNLPLAINKIQYNAAISYAQIREIPSFIWVRGADGKRTKSYKRKEYITKLSSLLAKELNMQAERIEDLVHGKAALFYNVPFVIKEDLSEKEYYRLKALEKDWLGIHAERAPRRSYPKGKVAGDILGYMGRINRKEFDKVLLEMRQLRDSLENLEAGNDILLPPGLNDTSEIRQRLQELEERAYTINDSVGKSGIEGMFDEDLRGFRGKRIYQSDAKGNYLRELPGAQEPLSGQRFLLTISSELQEYAEQLLAEHELLREGKSDKASSDSRESATIPSTWIKGGGIVVMDPNNGEVLALASYPRFDPNDFIPSGEPLINKSKLSSVRRWLESEEHIAELWDQKQPLCRERFSPMTGQFYEESKWMNLSNYLNAILPKDHPIAHTLDQFNTLEEAVNLQRYLDELLFLCEEPSAISIINALYAKEEEHVPYRNHQPYSSRKALAQSLANHTERAAELKSLLNPYFQCLKNNYDKILFADLCKVLVHADSFSTDLLNAVGKQTLSSHRDASAAFSQLYEEIKKEVKKAFHLHHFSEWRKQHQKEFLLQKRKEELAKGHYQKPYIDYLDNKENELFNAFWQAVQWDLLHAVFLDGSLPSDELAPYINKMTQLKNTIASEHSYTLLKKALAGLTAENQLAYLKTLRAYKDLTRPLFGIYPHLSSPSGTPLEKHLASAFYPRYGFGYGRSQAFRQATQQGSLFKLVTAYEALRQTYHSSLANQSFQCLNPLIIIDEVQKIADQKKPGEFIWNVGRTIDGKPIPQHYKGGRLPRSSKTAIGKVDLIGALEASSNPYFALLAGEVIRNPEDLVHAAHLFSYGEKTGIELPGEIAGKVPTDCTFDRTGLYSLAIGQHSLVATPLQTAVMLSTIANGGNVYRPKMISLTAGKEPVRGEDQIFQKEKFAYQEALSLIGIDFPLFTSAESLNNQATVACSPPELVRQIFLPDCIRDILLTGMRQVMIGSRGIGHPSKIRSLKGRPMAIKDYLDLQSQLIGKTSTAEVMERINLDLKEGTQLVTHVWFGGIAFENPIVSPLPPKNSTFSFEKPELVVVVYLRYGDYGKEAAPIALQLVKKWREIKTRHAP